MTDVENPEFKLILGPRQIAVGLFMAVVVTGTFGAMTYVVGRAVMPVSAAERRAAPVDAVRPLEVSRPIGAPEPFLPSLPRPAPEANGSYFREPRSGQIFLQVAAVDRGPAEVFAEYLTRKRFPCQVATGPDERSYRILVGPIQENSQLDTFRAGLQEAGFQPFVRRY